MDIEKMGGSVVYAKYIALTSKDYTLAPLKNKYKSALDYYAIDGAGNWGNELFHYCSINTLKSITQNMQLRFTDVQSLKDTTEFVNAIHLLKLVMEEQENFMDEELYNILNDGEIFTKLEDYSQRYPFYSPINNKRDIDGIKPICKVYTCSLALHGDLPNMWNEYAKGGGVSIGFKELERCMKAGEQVKIIFGKVWYQEDDKKQCINALLKDVCEIFSLIPDAGCRKDMIQTILVSAMNHMRIFMKNEMYSPEDEYRAVLIVPEEIIRSNQLPEKFDNGDFIKENRTIPYIDVPFTSESISHIIVGSGIKEKFSQVKIDIEDWLLQQNLSNINIYESNLYLCEKGLNN